MYENEIEFRKIAHTMSSNACTYNYRFSNYRLLKYCYTILIARVISSLTRTRASEHCIFARKGWQFNFKVDCVVNSTVDYEEVRGISNNK